MAFPPMHAVASRAVSPNPSGSVAEIGTRGQRTNARSARAAAAPPPTRFDGADVAGGAATTVFDATVDDAVGAAAGGGGLAASDAAEVAGACSPAADALRCGDADASDGAAGFGVLAKPPGAAAGLGATTVFAPNPDDDPKPVDENAPVVLLLADELSVAKALGFASEPGGLPPKPPPKPPGAGCDDDVFDAAGDGTEENPDGDGPASFLGALAPHDGAAAPADGVTLPDKLLNPPPGAPGGGGEANVDVDLPAGDATGGGGTAKPPALENALKDFVPESLGGAVGLLPKGFPPPAAAGAGAPLPPNGLLPPPAGFAALLAVEKLNGLLDIGCGQIAATRGRSTRRGRQRWRNPCSGHRAVYSTL